MKTHLILIVLLLFNACTSDSRAKETEEPSELPAQYAPLPPLTTTEKIIHLFQANPNFQAKGFDYPVGKPNSKGYYNAQGFGANTHLGDDWNAVTGGNSDLGDPIYATANGYVHFTEDWGGGWGNIIRVWHQTTDSLIVESFYAHCDTILVEVGDFVGKGQQIGTIGDAHGSYLAHLHFEIREDVDLPIGGGYGADKTGYLDPTAFIKANR